MSVFIPPNYTTIAIITRSRNPLAIEVFIPASYMYQVINATFVIIKSPLTTSIYSGSGITVSNVDGWTVLSISGNYTYVVLNLGGTSIIPINELMNINNNEVSNWLGVGEEAQVKWCTAH